MAKTFYFSVFVILILFLSSCGSLPKQEENKLSEKDTKEIQAAKGVIQRLIGNRANDISLQLISAKDSLDTYEIVAKNGELTIKGSSSVAMTFGFYQYLKKATHSMVSWSGKNLNLPENWPDFQEKATSPYKYRYFLNVVTYGYTTPYWDWNRWQKEIDWMALHGINMPLTPIASEEIYKRVWKKLGLTDENINAYFTGPAYLPWHRMGNINRWDGPLTESWHKDQVDLQHKILDRMHELGFETIAPGYAGFVPPAFSRLNPEAEIDTLKWGGFPKEDNTYFLRPTSPYFKKIGKLFIQEWEKEFGKNKYYLSDSFNEMDVPVPKDHPEKKYEILADYGKSIYESIKAGDPDAVWVTQGWTFGWQHKFWDKKTLEAMLSKVPDDKMIILDLANEYPDLVWHIAPLWKTHEGFYGKKWIYSYVPNFGGKSPFTGVLSMYASGSINALNSPYSKNLIGFGSAPEGIENNEVVYELLGDMGWSSKKINLDKWMESYCDARYGSYPQEMKFAWEDLRKSVYSSFSPYPRYVWQLVTPDPRRRGSVHDSKTFRKGVENFLAASDEFKVNQLYLNDAIELSAFYLGNIADEYYKQALKAKKDGDEKLKREAGEKVISLLKDIDRLLESHPTDKLQNWIDFARLHGQTKEQKDYYESNAKRLITIWGGVNEDYAARIWSGLIRDYYIPRIEHFLYDDQFDINQWQQDWVEKPGITKANPFNNPLQKAKELVTKYSNQPPVKE